MKLENRFVIKVESLSYPERHSTYYLNLIHIALPDGVHQEDKFGADRILKCGFTSDILEADKMDKSTALMILKNHLKEIEIKSNMLGKISVVVIPIPKLNLSQTWCLELINL